jgi:hypothetical protein
MAASMSSSPHFALFNGFRWVLADLEGKGIRIRTLAVPVWVHGVPLVEICGFALSGYGG